MKNKILVTGGCGFIGSHIVDNLVAEGHDVRILDNLDKQVHEGKKPNYLNPKAEYFFGDVRNEEDVKKAIQGIEVIFHEAAVVGVGQSMYQVKRYADNNVMGTANILDIIVNTKNSIRKMIIASSMSIYGEGLYECPKCGPANQKLRPREQLLKRDWEPKCLSCKSTLKPIPTHEEKPLNPTSVYAVTKKDQEEMFMNIGNAYGIPTVALRYFNVYGPRQSLSNPYTGVAAIFSSAVKNKNPPIIFEDGLQSRDFVSVYDIAAANVFVMKNNKANYGIFNVGSGRPISIRDVAENIIKINNSSLKPIINNKFREGDIRHCFADISKIRSIGFEPKISFEEGIKELAEWGITAESNDKTSQALKELEQKGLSK